MNTELTVNDVLTLHRAARENLEKLLLLQVRHGRTMGKEGQAMLAEATKQYSRTRSMLKTLKLNSRTGALHG